MTTMNKTLYPLSENDRAQLLKLLPEMQKHRMEFNGSVRDYYDAMSAHTPIAANVRCEQAGASGWWLHPQSEPTERVVVFIHGGAYMLGSALAYRGFASQLAVRSGCSTFVADYPLAPEQPFPAAPDAVNQLLLQLISSGIRDIALVGDSAGGALSLVAVQNPEIEGHIRSVTVFSPWTDLAFSGHSFNDATTHDPVFQPSILRDAAKSYLQSNDARDVQASPLYARPLALPPLLIQVGTEELLLDDATRYADIATESSGEVQLGIYQGMHHVFQRDITLAAARHALDTAASFINQHWKD